MLHRAPSFLLAVLVLSPGDAAARVADPIEVAGDLTLEPGQVLDAPLVIVADGVTIEGNGATVRGAGTPGDLASLTGVGVRVAGRRGVTIRGLNVHGFEIGLKADDCEGLVVEGCDFSDNYHDPEHGWGDGSRNGGLILTGVTGSRFVGNRANRVWNGIDLWGSDDNEIRDNDVSRCSNVCLKLWRSSRNRIVDNDLSWGLRIREGEVHARDSTSVLIETGSDDNLFERNDCTHGGDGIFIRPLNNWLSTGNVFVENDCSYANNNGFECWSPGNTFLRNKANHCSYGFWLGGSDATVLIGNEAAYNGQPDGFHNAPESDFRHGGIVIVHGTGRHTLIQDNHCHHNNGGGIVFRGDLRTRGGAWRMQHLVVQGNRLEHNQWGIFGRFADDLFLAGNTFEGNEEDERFEDVTRVVRGAGGGRPSLVAAVDGPSRAAPGEEVVFAARVTTEEGAPVVDPRIRWDVDGEARDGATVAATFTRPGLHRVALTVDDGDYAALAWRDLYVIPAGEERGTEGDVARWRASLGGDADGRGRVGLTADEEAIVGARSLRIRPDPYPGHEVVVSLPGDPSWDLAAKAALSFWLRFRNPNYGFQGPTIVRLRAGDGMFTYVPVDGGRPRNLLQDLPYPEARGGWQHVEVPLGGGDGWMRTEGFDGAPPAHFERDLRLTTVDTGVETQDTTSLTSDGAALYLATKEGDRMLRSEDGAAWTELPSPRAALGASGDWINGMLAFHRAGPDDGGALYLRLRAPERDEHGLEWNRLADYDLGSGEWSWLPTRMDAGHGSVVVGDHLFAIAHALGANYGGAIERVDLIHPPARADRSSHARLPGADQWWLSRAAQLAAVGGRVYAIKNDWRTPQPTDPAECGDRLFSFDPGDYAPSTYRGGHPWKEDQWAAAYTPVADLGPLPFEVGHGAALVGLPPRWSKDVGSEGGLFVIAGSSPSDHEGQGTPSADFAIYDVASKRFVRGRFPDATGVATSATFHLGRVYVKRGGMNFPTFNAQLWVVEPVAEDEAARGREAQAARRVSLGRVERIELQFDSNGYQPFDVWIDGLRFR